MFIRNKLYGNAFISYESLIIELWAIITGVYMADFIFLLFRVRCKLLFSSFVLLTDSSINTYTIISLHLLVGNNSAYWLLNISRI